MDSNILMIILLIVTFLISILPLHFSVKLFGGKTSILKTGAIVILSTIILLILKQFVTWYLVSFVLLIFIYKSAFSLSWIRALLAWFMQFFIVGFIVFIVFLITGIILF